MSNKVTIEQVKIAVYSWSIRFRETIYDNEQLAFLSREYHEDIVDERVTFGQFQAAARLVRKRCNFFPKVADILKAREEIGRNPERFQGGGKTTQIEDTTDECDLTPEETERNQRRVNVMTRQIAGDITAEEAEKLQNEINAEGEFSGRMAV